MIAVFGKVQIWSELKKIFFHEEPRFYSICTMYKPTKMFKKGVLGSAWSCSNPSWPPSLLLPLLAGGRCAVFPPRHHPRGIYPILHLSLHAHHHQHLPTAVSPDFYPGRPILRLSRVCCCPMQYMGRPVVRCLQLQPPAAHVYKTGLQEGTASSADSSCGALSIF